MDDLFKSSQSDASDNNANSGHEPSIEDGLAALRRKDYGNAIALLQSVVQAAPDKPTETKAQMSLVMAYERSGDLTQAIALSQRLSKSSNRQVRLWAMRMIEELMQRPDMAAELSLPAPVESVATDEDRTGFVPLGSPLPTEVQTTLQDEETGDSEADATGFVPLSETTDMGLSDRTPEQRPTPRHAADISAAQAHESMDDSGFVPLTDASAFTPSQPDETSSASANIPPTPDTTAVPSASRHTPQSQPLPNAVPTVAQSAQAPPPREWVWRQAGRASKWGPLGSVDLAKLWAVEVATLIALVFVVRAFFQIAIVLFNVALIQLRWLIDLRQFSIFIDPFWVVVVVLGVLFLASPWLMDGILKVAYRARPLRLEELATSSPEAVRVLKRVCNQRRFPVPALRLLPIAAPVALTYGLLPQNTCIVVSQGLLQQLNDDEIATIVIGELGHVTHWDAGVASGMALVAQLPYQAYWALSTWGDRQPNPLLKAIAVGVASLNYGLFWVFRRIGLWLFRLRVFYSDRTAVEMTGNPNGLIRALLKITRGIATDIQRQGLTSPLLESLDGLTPVGCQTALTLGSASPYTSLEELLIWDRVNPYRHWLAINNSHPPMGDRLQQLVTYARHWRLATELDFDTSSPANSYLSRQTKPFWVQSAPFIGLLIGLLIAGCFWVVGTIAAQVGWVELIWMSGDQSILWGCLLLGFSIGTILRINPFFPDIKSSTLQVEPILTDLLTVSYALPSDSQPVRLRGTLLGRSGIGNILSQDLILDTQSGCIHLHYMPLLGPIGHLLPQAIRPNRFVKSSVTITGWFRRGATPWIDVDTIQPQRGAKLQAAHPWWSTLLAVITAVLGAFIIFQGG